MPPQLKGPFRFLTQTLGSPTAAPPAVTWPSVCRNTAQSFKWVVLFGVSLAAICSKKARTGRSLSSDVVGTPATLSLSRQKLKDGERVSCGVGVSSGLSVRSPPRKQVFWTELLPSQASLLVSLHTQRLDAH